MHCCVEGSIMYSMLLMLVTDTFTHTLHCTLRPHDALQSRHVMFKHHVFGNMPQQPVTSNFVMLLQSSAKGTVLCGHPHKLCLIASDKSYSKFTHIVKVQLRRTCTLTSYTFRLAQRSLAHQAACVCRQLMRLTSTSFVRRWPLTA